MKKTLFTITAALITLTPLITGCQQQRPAYLDITPGQTVEEVEQILGPPDERRDEALVYDEAFYRVVIPVQQGRVTKRMHYENHEKDEPGVSKYWGTVH